MSQEVTTVRQLKNMLEQDKIKTKLAEVIGKNAGSFTTSLVQIVMSNEMLNKADPSTVFNAAMMAATLNLPLNNNLGFAYIVPYNNRKAKRVEAQFQLGYKGFIQLAQRSGQFKTISAAPVYEGQLVKENPLTGYEFDWSNKAGVDGAPIGYVAYFQLLNGFESTLYMSTPEISAHANRYSQSFKNGYGVWADNFEAMAIKTVLKLLLSKYAPLSIDMMKAVEADQAVVKHDGRFGYADNEVIDAEVAALATEEQIKEIENLAAVTGKGVPKICSAYGVESIAEMTSAQADEAILYLNNALDKQSAQVQEGDEIPV